MDNSELLLLLMSMIKKYDEHGDKIGYNKSELDDIVKHYEIADEEFSETDAILLYKYKYISKERFSERLVELLDEIYDTLEMVYFLEENNLLKYCWKEISSRVSEIKKENGKWYFYAKGGWSFFEDFFKIDSDTRDDIVKVILAGDSFDIFDYHNEFDIKESYLSIDEENLKYLKSVIQNMKKDFEIEQDDIDDVSDLDDIINLCIEYELDDLKRGLDNSYRNAQGHADESEAYNYVTDQIITFFNFGEELTWSDGDTLKFNFKDDDGVKDAILKMFKLDVRGEYDTDELIEYSSPYHGWNASSEDVEPLFNSELLELLPDYIGEYDV